MNTIQNWGGGESWHFKTAVNLSKLDYNIFFIMNEKSVLAQKIKDYPHIKPIYIEFNKFSYLNPMVHYKLYKNLKKYQIHNIIFNSIRDVNSASASAKLAGVQRSIFRYGSYKPLKKKLLTYLSLRFFLTDIFANSYALKEKLLKVGFIKNEEKVTVLYNYVKLPKEVLKEAHTPTLFGVSARLTFEKGFRPLIEALSHLKNRNFKLLIAGDGPDKKEIESLMVKYQVEEHIELKGFVKDIETFYKSIDVLLHFSYEDGTSNSILEAMSHQLPIVAFNQSSYPEMVSHKENGFLVQADNIEEMREAIEAFIENPSLVTSMGKASYHKIEKEFKEDLILKTFIERYIK